MFSNVDWTQVFTYGPTAILLLIVLSAVIKLAPTWKEVKLRELDLRKDEGKIREQQSAALTTLAGSITTLAEATTNMTGMMEDLAIHQRKSTEELQIMQRVNADSNDRLVAEVRLLSDRVDRFETLHPADGNSAAAH